MPIAVTAAAGVPVEVALERYATAGYRWELAEAPAGVAVSAPDGGDTAVAAAAAAPGSPGRQVFRLQGAQPGTYVIRFDSRRPWETAAARSELVTFIVTPP